MFTYRVDPTGFRTLSGSVSCAVGDTVAYFLFLFFSSFFFGPCLPGKGRVGGERGDIQDGGGKFLGLFFSFLFFHTQF